MIARTLAVPLARALSPVLAVQLRVPVSRAAYVPLMQTNQKPAVLFLRMSPQLRQALRLAADHAGCSLNAFAVQVLATAAGDPAAFRASVDEVREPAPHELERDALGYPVEWKARTEHIGARSNFIGSMEGEVGSAEMVRLVKHYDAENPSYFVEWQRQRRAEGRVS